MKSKEARRHSGEHYTSEKNILKTIEPLFLDELRAEARRLINSKSTSVKKLREFRDSLANNIYCDPACGSGNFLIVAYRELRKIETEMIVAIREREGSAGSMTFDISWEQKLSIDQFYGFEINWWPAKIAETAMFLVDHQANRELADAIGLAPERLPINITAHIHHGNALQLDWAEILPETSGQTYIFGNPPFLGARTMNKAQKADLNEAWNGAKGTNQLDYVTGWHAKAITLFENRTGAFAYVTTNSITQGDQPARLFKVIFDNHWRIRFAHRTFAWDSEAPGKAAVHCVIVGFDRDGRVPPKLWDYPDLRGEGTEVEVKNQINAYLVDGPRILVEKLRTPLSPMLSPARFGSMPNDGGHLIVEIEDYAEIVNDTIAAKYLRPFRMGRELVRGLDRWCLWMVGEKFDPRDISLSRILKNRIDAVCTHRLASKRVATQKRAEVPYLFGELHQPDHDYVAIPRVVSENRKYYTVAHLSPEIIAGDKVYTAADPDGLLFALISSSMFMTWQRTVGGRLKSDLNFAATLTWNTFPVPDIDNTSKERIIAAGKKVLEARELHPGRSLADHYNPLAMDPALLKAHDALDKEVDKAFGAPRKLSTERQRQELLFENYARLSKL